MSRTFEFNKLVRDNIANISRDQGHDVVERKLTKNEHILALLNKFDEEFAELKKAIKDGDDVIGELADVQTIITSLTKLLGVSQKDLQSKIDKKNARNGAFDDGVYIETETLNENGNDYDYWVDYFVKNADRYPEITKEREGKNDKQPSI